MQSSPGFLAERLKQARTSMELSVTALSQQIGISRQSIDQFERGQITPSEATLLQLSDKLKQPREFFFKPLSEFTISRVLYRSNSKARITVKKRVEVRFLWLCELVEFLDKYVNLPKFTFPDFNWLPDDPREINQQTIEKVAEELRSFWNIAEYHPIPDLVKLLEYNGFIVATDDLCDEGIEALSAWGYLNRGYILIHKYVGSAVRMRFGIAHELGHLILHKKVDFSREPEKDFMNLLEDQANAFSGAFLAPKIAFSRDVGAVTLDRLRIIKTKWLISIGAMIKRSEKLGLISSESVKSLFINYGRRGWRGFEPLDDSIVFEEPKVIPDAINLLIEQRFFSSNRLETSSGISYYFASSIMNSRLDIATAPVVHQSYN